MAGVRHSTLKVGPVTVFYREAGLEGRPVLLLLHGFANSSHCFRHCNPASGNEKGGVEGELGWFRRNWMAPVPEASVLDELNQHILDPCLENRSRTILGRGMTIGQASELEREHLSPLAEEGFPIEELLYPVLVDSMGRVKVRTNWYKPN